MKTFIANVSGIKTAQELIEKRLQNISAVINREWFPESIMLNAQLGQWQEVSPNSWIVQLVLPNTDCANDLVPCMATAVVNASPDHESYHFVPIDVVCCCMSGYYESVILDKLPNIGFDVKKVLPAFDCKIFDQDDTQMVVQSKLFLLPTVDSENLLKFSAMALKKTYLKKVQGGLNWWLPVKRPSVSKK